MATISMYLLNLEPQKISAFGRRQCLLYGLLFEILNNVHNELTNYGNMLGKRELPKFLLQAQGLLALKQEE